MDEAEDFVWLGDVYRWMKRKIFLARGCIQMDEAENFVG